MTGKFIAGRLFKLPKTPSGNVEFFKSNLMRKAIFAVALVMALAISCTAEEPANVQPTVAEGGIGGQGGTIPPPPPPPPGP